MNREYASALLCKFPSLDPMWPEPIKDQWNSIFGKLLVLEKHWRGPETAPPDKTQPEAKA